MSEIINLLRNRLFKQMIRQVNLFYLISILVHQIYCKIETRVQYQRFHTIKELDYPVPPFFAPWFGFNSIPPRLCIISFGIPSSNILCKPAYSLSQDKGKRKYYYQIQRHRRGYYRPWPPFPMQQPYSAAQSDLAD